MSETQLFYPPSEQDKVDPNTRTPDGSDWRYDDNEDTREEAHEMNETFDRLSAKKQEIMGGVALLHAIKKRGENGHEAIGDKLKDHQDVAQAAHVEAYQSESGVTDYVDAVQYVNTLPLTRAESAGYAASELLHNAGVSGDAPLDREGLNAVHAQADKEKAQVRAAQDELQGKHAA